MNIEPDSAAKIFSPGPVKEEEEVTELEFEEDHEEETIINQSSVVPVAVASEEVGSQDQFGLPLILKDKVLDIVLKLHPAQAPSHSQLWLGLRSGQYPPLLRVFDGLDLGQLASQLASLLEEYACQIETASAVAAPRPKAETSSKPVVPSPVQVVQPTTIREAGNDKKVEQLSFF